MAIKRILKGILGSLLLLNTAYALEPDEGGIGGTGNSETVDRPDSVERPESIDRIERIERPEILDSDLGSIEPVGGDAAGGTPAAPPE